MRRYAVAVLLALSFAVVGASVSHAQAPPPNCSTQICGHEFQTMMVPEEEVPPVEGDQFGFARVSFNETFDRMSFNARQHPNNLKM